MKVKLVTELQHITELAKLIPLYFEALYLEMNERDWMDYEVIESMLIKAFLEGPFTAYGKLRKAKWIDLLMPMLAILANWVSRIHGEECGEDCLAREVTHLLDQSVHGYVLLVE